ncbi:YfhO family protein [uncultured Ruminococcus sp.]|uniref:YfhO family protein n=1 Tax=uncultured Ruminococcus sp. TaxID=165186 RepID=UPI00292FB40A|nr:YfhO family protein [uncultured Ruminococcus sp.]
MKLIKNDQKRRPYALFAFLWALILSVAIIVPIMIKDQGYFLYYGDFNVQEIPFYQLCHDSILSGNTGWSHLTDLGANFVGSYSFYLLGSPFFLLTLPLPSGWVPYAIGPLLALKLSFSSMTAYIYLKRYVRDPRYAVMGGLLYAFSGFSLFNVFFFHFHEAMIVLPLLLAALDEYHATGRKGLVAAAVFLCATINYYFFFGQALFAVIYYFVKLSVKAYRFSLKGLLTLLLEGSIGVCLSCFLLLPSVAAIIGNYRVSSLINGWNIILYPRTQRYIQILNAFFFPSDIPAQNNFTPDAGGKWASVAAYLPMFSMTFVIAYLRVHKKTFFKRLLVILFIMALIPVLNTAFQALNSAYYARWFYMLTLMMITVTIKGIEELDLKAVRKGFIPTVVITLSITLIIGLTPQKTEDNAKREIIKLGISKYPKRFWIFAAMAIGGLILSFLLYWIAKKKPLVLFRSTALALSLFIIGYSSIYLWCGKRITDHSDSFMIESALNGGKDVTLPDIHEVRSDFYQSADNIGLFWKIQNIQTFHSIVPGSTIDFYNSVGVKRDVASNPGAEYYGLRGLLSVKYLFEEENSKTNNSDHVPPLPGFRYVNTENGYREYVNEHYVPMGFVYDSFITEEEFRDISNEGKHLALMKAMVLSQDQMAAYADITGYRDGQYLNLNFRHNPNDPQDQLHPEYEGYESITKSFRYSEEEYMKDADRLAESACSSFKYTSDGFSAEFDNRGDDNLLFFSVPFDEGWSAKVNGEPAKIEKVNVGFMAIRVKGNTKSEIRFTYRTPMLTEGMIISAIGAGIFIIYFVINRGFRAKRKARRKYRIKQKSESISLGSTGGLT